MPNLNPKEFLSRQLNDHHDSPSGVRQKLYYEWTQQHLCDAICMGLDYVYSLRPESYSDLKELKVDKAECIISFCECAKFLAVAAIVDSNGKACTQVNEVTGDTNSLLSLLKTDCSDKGSSDELSDNYEYEVINGSTCIVQFKEMIPKGTVIKYMCATPPEDADAVNDPSLREYRPLVSAFALWWLLLTDNESRSNLERVSFYYTMIRDFVETKLLLDFSLREDDYLYGRRRVDD